MINGAFSIGLSGIRVANEVTKMLSHNIANANTPGYKRLENHNYEINFSGPNNKPFLPGGVGTNIVSGNNYPWLDNRYNDALGAKAEADAVKEGVDQLEKITTDETLEKAFSTFMNASHDLKYNPNEPVYKERFDLAGEAFVERLNALDNSFADAQTDITEKIDLNNIRLQNLQSQLQSLTSQTNSEDVVSEINYLKQQISQVTGSISGYQKVLQKIVPPVTAMYSQAKADVIDGSNNSYQTEIISTGANGYTWNREPINNINDLVEFGNQKFNKDLGRIKTVIGSLQENANIGASYGDSTLSAAADAYNSAYAVDIEEQAIKLKEYERYYEANMLVIKTADNMLGTLLDTFS